MADNLGEARIDLFITLDDGKANTQLNQFFSDFGRSVDSAVVKIKEFNNQANTKLGRSEILAQYNSIVKNIESMGERLGIAGTQMSSVSNTSEEMSIQLKMNTEDTLELAKGMTEAARAAEKMQQMFKAVSRLDPSSSVVSDSNDQLEAISSFLNSNEAQELTGDIRVNSSSSKVTAETLDISPKRQKEIADAEKLLVIQKAALKVARLKNSLDEKRARATSGVPEADLLLAKEPQTIETGSHAELLEIIKNLDKFSPHLTEVQNRVNALSDAFSKVYRSMSPFGTLIQKFNTDLNKGQEAISDFFGLPNEEEKLQEFRNGIAARKEQIAQLKKELKVATGSVIDSSIGARGPELSQAKKDTRTSLSSAKEQLKVAKEIQEVLESTNVDDFGLGDVRSININRDRIEEVTEEIRELEEHLQQLNATPILASPADITSDINNLSKENDQAEKDLEERAVRFVKLQQRVEDFGLASREKLIEAAMALKKSAEELNDAGEFIEKTDFSDVLPEDRDQAKEIDKQATARLNEEMRLESAQRGLALARPLANAEEKRNNALADINNALKEGLVDSRESLRVERQINAEYTDAVKNQKDITAVIANRRAKELRQQGFTVSDAGRQLLTGAAPFAAMITTTLPLFAEFEQKVANVAAVLDDFTGFKSNVDELSDSFLRLGEVTEFTAVQISEAARALGLAGFELSEIQEALPNVIALASAGNIDPTESADIMANVLRAFDIAATNSIRVADAFAVVATQSNVTVGTLGESFKLLAPITASLGQPLEEVTAALGILGDAGIRGSRAGTGLSRAFSELLEKSEDFDLKLKEVGSSFEKIDPEKVGISEIISEFERLKSGGLLDTADLFELFDQRSARVMVTLINQGSDAFKKLEASASDAAGAAEKIRKLRLDTLEGDIKILRSAWDSFQIAVGESLSQTFRPFVKVFIDIIQWMSKWAEENKTVVAGLKNLAISLTTSVTLIGSLMIAVGGLMRVQAGAILINQLFNDTFWLMLTNIRTYITNVYAAVVANGVWSASILGVRAAFAALMKAGQLLILGAILTVISLIVVSISDLVSESRELKNLESLNTFNDSLKETTENLDKARAAVSRFKKDVDLLKNLPTLNQLQVSELVAPGSFLTADLEAEIEEIESNILKAGQDLKSMFGRSSGMQGNENVGITVVEDSSGAMELAWQGANEEAQKHVDLSLQAYNQVEKLVESGTLAEKVTANDMKDMKEAATSIKNLIPVREAYVNAFSGGLTTVNKEYLRQTKNAAELARGINAIESRKQYLSDKQLKNAEDKLKNLKKEKEFTDSIVESLDNARKAGSRNFDITQKIMAATKRQAELKKKQKIAINDADGERNDNVIRIQDAIKKETELLARLAVKMGEIVDLEKERAAIRQTVAAATEAQEERIKKLKEEQENAKLREKSSEEIDQIKAIEALEELEDTKSIADFFKEEAERMQALENDKSVKIKVDVFSDLDQKGTDRFNKMVKEGRISVADAEEAIAEDLKSKAIKDTKNKIENIKTDYKEQRDAIRRLRRMRAEEGGISDKESKVRQAQLKADEQQKLDAARELLKESTKILDKRTQSARALKKEEKRLLEASVTDATEVLNKKKEEDKKKKDEDRRERQEDFEDEILSNKLKLAEITKDTEKWYDIRNKQAKRQREKLADSTVGTIEDIQALDDPELREKELEKRQEILESAKQLFDLQMTEKKRKEAEQKRVELDKKKKEREDRLRELSKRIDSKRIDIEKKRLEIQDKIRDNFFQQARTVREIIALTRFLNRAEAIRMARTEKLRKRGVSFQRRLLDPDKSLIQRLDAMSRLAGVGDQLASRQGGGEIAKLFQVFLDNMKDSTVNKVGQTPKLLEFNLAEVFSQFIQKMKEANFNNINVVPNLIPPAGLAEDQAQAQAAAKGISTVINSNNKSVSVENFNIEIVADSISNADDVFTALKEKQDDLRKLLFPF